MAKTLNEFNAEVGLKDFNPAAEGTFAAYRNNLKVGESYLFYDTGETAKWNRDNQKNPLVRTEPESGAGVECHSAFVASMMIDQEGVVANPGTELECVVNARLAKVAGKEFKTVNDNKTDKGTFPKVKVEKMLPVAMKIDDLLTDRVNEETKKLYATNLGATLEELKKKGLEYVPNYRKAQVSDRVFSIRTGVVTLN